MRRERDEQVTRHQLIEGGQGPHSGDRNDAGLDGLRLVSRHQRAAARVAQQRDGDEGYRGP
jgi:hypothetical protein